MIPQCDPHASYVANSDAIDLAVKRVLASGRYILGDEVREFEAEFAAAMGFSSCYGVANGTDALALALRASGVNRGDLVLTVSHTAVATAVAIRAAGANPVFVDVDEESGLLDPLRLDQAIHELRRSGVNATAVVPVHLYGECADMEAIASIAADNDLIIVEDCAQAHGASFSGRAAGTWSACASFSFYPTKNLGTFGDGGAVACNDDEVAATVQLLRQYGWKQRYISDIEGTNSRLDELHAAILRVKLPLLQAGNAARRRIARRYHDEIRNSAVSLQRSRAIDESVFHQFTVRTAHRDDLRGHLAAHSIGTLVHYPQPVHLQPAYQDKRFSPMPLPSTEAWASSVVSLPMFPELKDEQVSEVVAAVNSWRAPG
jgi:dTDP-4-amino-4,6-dideoxygalactose transaminase